MWYEKGEKRREETDGSRDTCLGTNADAEPRERGVEDPGTPGAGRGNPTTHRPPFVRAIATRQTSSKN